MPWLAGLEMCVFFPREASKTGCSAYSIRRAGFSQAQRSFLIEWFAAALTHLWRFPAQFNLALLINIALLASSDGQWMLIELLPGLIEVWLGFGEASSGFPSNFSGRILQSGHFWYCIITFFTFFFVLFKIFSAAKPIFQNILLQITSSLVSGAMFAHIILFSIPSAFSFSSSWCYPEWRPCQEPGTLPRDKTPTCKPCREQDLGHKVGKLTIMMDSTTAPEEWRQVFVWPVIWN